MTNGLSGRARDALGVVLARNRTRPGGFASLRLEHFLAAEGAHPAGGDPGDARASKPL